MLYSSAIIAVICATETRPASTAAMKGALRIWSSTVARSARIRLTSRRAFSRAAVRLCGASQVSRLARGVGEALASETLDSCVAATIKLIDKTLKGRLGFMALVVQNLRRSSGLHA